MAGKRFRPGETAFEGKVLPSEVIFGIDRREARSIGEGLKHSFFSTEGLLRLGVDIFFDPFTYLTLGVGSAVKLTTKAGMKVAVSKTGLQLTKELAEEVGEKAARQTVASLASIERTATTLSKGGLQNIKRGLAAAGKPFTRKNIDEVLEQGIKELRAAGGIKYMGKTIVGAEVAKAPFKWVLEGVKATRIGSEMVEALTKVGQSMVKLVNRDYGLDKLAIKNKQIFLDSFAAAQQRISDQVAAIFGGTTKAQREAITLAIEDGVEGIARLSPELRILAKRTKDILKAIGKEEEKKGLLNSWISDYVTHAYRNVEGRKTLLRTMREGQPSALLRFAKERRIPTIREAEALGLEPIKDIAEIMNMRLVASQKAIMMQDFYKETALTLGKRLGVGTKTLSKNLLELGENPVRLGDVGTGIPKGFRDIFIPANIADDILKMERRFFNDDELNLLLRGYDKALNFFKGSVTVMFPAFHGRNAISNVWQNFLDIGIQAINPSKHKEAVSIMTKADGFLITELGTKISYAEIRKLAKAKQVLTNRVTMVDIDRRLAESPFKRNTPFEIGRKLGRAIENEARMVNFITNLRRGFDVDDAAQRVKDFIMDYDNLSLFEKNVMRRFLPFYCVSEDTDILTDRGWKKNYEVKKEDKLLTYNLRTKELEWQIHNGIFSFNYEGYLIHFNTFNLDLLCTPNHRCITKEYGIKEAIDIGYANHCPMVGINKNPDFEISDRILSLISWVISEGSYRRNKSEIVIYQKNYKEEIEKLLKEGEFSINIHPETKVYAYRLIGELRKEIKRWFDYGLFNLIIQLSQRQCNLFKEIITLAGGSFTRPDFIFIAQEKNEYRDLIQLIWFLSGYNCKLGKRGFYERKYQLAKYQKKNLVWYKGKVWCPSTENTTAVFRRNGIIVISGQTWTRKNLAIQLKALVEQPGKQVNTLKVLSRIDEMFGVPRTAQEKEFAPDYIREGMNMLLARKDDDSTFLVGFDIPIEDAFEVFNRPDRKILNMLSPYLKVLTEVATGYNLFKGEKIKEDDSGRVFRGLPEPIKKWLEYTRKEVETKEGKKFTIEKVNPQKKWIFQTVASVTGGGRFVSTGFVEPMNSLWKMMKGDEGLTIEDKVNFVRFLTGIRAFTIDIEASQRAIEKNDLRELEDILIRAGVLGRFEKTFEPAELRK